MKRSNRIKNGLRRIINSCIALLLAAAPLVAAELSEAEKAWEEFQAASRQPPQPKEWRSKRPTKEEYDAYVKKVMQVLAVSADKAKEFYAKYPNDPNAARAKRKEYEFLDNLVGHGDLSKAERLAELEKTRLADPALSADDRFQIRMKQVNRAAKSKEKEGMGAIMAELEKGARQLAKEFPDKSEVYNLLMVVAEQSEAEKARPLAEEILKQSAANEKIKQRANLVLHQLEQVGKTLDIEFEAMDGRKVSLAGLKGKVVLIDFWATWCGPCIAELPNVLKAYENLHPKGFEIIGISLDKEKGQLAKFVEENKMPWPQYFDGEVWGNKYAKQYGIHGIPAMWMVDKKGRLRYLHARDGLEEKAKTLLAE